jgi:hypothetical protein
LSYLQKGQKRKGGTKKGKSRLKAARQEINQLKEFRDTACIILPLPFWIAAGEKVQKSDDVGNLHSVGRASGARMRTVEYRGARHIPIHLGIIRRLL